MATEAHDLTAADAKAAPTAQTPHREALTKIINQFTATHVFIRHQRWRPNMTDIEIWESAFQKTHSDCVSSIAELVEAKKTNYSLYESSMGRWVDEMECLYRKLRHDYDQRYPRKMYISYTPPVSTSKLGWRERLSIVRGQNLPTDEHQTVGEKMTELAELANLTYFNGNFYAKTPNGCPIESIRYNLKELDSYNKAAERPSIDEAIVTLANAILNV